MLEQKIIEAYSDGSPMSVIIESFNIPEKVLKKILLDYKNENKTKKSFTDEFKKVIASRDLNGIPRRQISFELEINVNTIKKACEKFGQAFKDKAVSENAYTRTERELDLTTCPTCNSKRVNIVDDDTTYCINCGDEYVHKKDHVLRVNWEHIE